MTEAEFLAALRTLPLHPGAQGLRDDVAHLGDLILTTDTIVEGVHYLASETPADVAWKLVAVNLSDLAAKGAVHEGIMHNYPPRAAPPAVAGVQLGASRSEERRVGKERGSTCRSRGALDL